MKWEGREIGKLRVGGKVKVVNHNGHREGDNNCPKLEDGRILTITSFQLSKIFAPYIWVNTKEVYNAIISKYLEPINQSLRDLIE